MAEFDRSKPHINVGTIGPRFMESTAFNHASLQPLHSIGNHWAMLHGIHCIQSGSI